MKSSATHTELSIATKLLARQRETPDRMVRGIKVMLERGDRVPLRGVADGLVAALSGMGPG